jgi:hypothetical protein
LSIILNSPVNNTPINCASTINFTITNSTGSWWSKTKLFDDNFDDGNVSEWTTIGGTWGVENGEYSQNDTTQDETFQSYIGNTSWGNYLILGKVKMMNGTKAGIMGRWQNESNFYLFWFANDTGFSIYKRVNDVYYRLNGNFSLTPNASKWYQFKAILYNNTLTFVIDGIGVLNATDDSFSSGKIGLKTYATHAHFDNISVFNITPLSQPCLIYGFECVEGKMPVYVWAYNNTNEIETYYQFLIDKTPPRVENVSVQNITEGQNEFKTVEAYDENGISKVLVEDYEEYKKFDFGTATSPVETDFINVTKNTVYPANGYGWTTAVDNDYDRGIGNDLERDFVYDNDNRTFNIDLPNDDYLVTVLLGDKGSYSHDNMNVYAEDVLKLYNVTTAAGEVKWLNFTITVTDGQLNITFNDGGGTDSNWVCEGLTILRKAVTQQMMHDLGNRYNTTIVTPKAGHHVERFIVNDTSGNINDQLTDWYYVNSKPRVDSLNAWGYYPGPGRLDDVYPGRNVSYGTQVRIYAYISDNETDSSNLVNVKFSIKTNSSSTWNIYNNVSGSWEPTWKYWYVDWIVSTNATLGYYDTRVYAEDGQGGSVRLTEYLEFGVWDNTLPTVENSTLNKTVNLGDNVTIFVDVLDSSNVSSVIVEDYSEFLRFDFQPDSSPVQKDYIKVNRTMLYPFTSNGRTFGWDASVFDDRDRNVGTRLTRDFVFDSANREFKVDLPNGTYNVNIFIGDMNYTHNMIDVFAEGQLKLSNLNNTAGTVNVYDFIVKINDGQLNIVMHEGGSDPYWVLNGLVIKSLNKTYVMSHLSGNTYLTTVLTPPQGFHSIRYVANDTAGNINDNVIDSFYVNVKPTLTNISSNTSCVKQNSPINITTYNASDLNGDDLILRVSSSPKAYNLCNSSAGQPERFCVFNATWNDTGSHVIYGLIDDGLTVSEERSITIYLDNSGPNPPTGLNPVNNSVRNSNPAFTWSVPSDVGCNGTINGYNISVYTDSSCTILYNTTSSTSNSYAFPNPFSNGTYYWKVRAIDGFNNLGSWSGCMKLIIDTIPPRVENSSINKTVEFGDSATALVDVLDENGVDKVILFMDVYQFDFGTSISPVQAGFTRVTKSTTYPTNGSGWITAADNDYDRGIGNDLERDFIYDNVNRTFNIDLSNGNYFVTVLLGDKGTYPHDNMNVYSEDVLKLFNVTTAAGEVKLLNFIITVTAGQLNIMFNDGGGTDPNWVCEGLIIRKLTQSYNMNKLANNTYTVVITNPPLGNHTVLYFANDTVGNVNDSVVDSFNVIMPPPAKLTSVTITPSIVFNNTIYVGSGITKFNITFDKNMNMSVQPNVTFELFPIIIDDDETGYNDTEWNIAPPNGPAQGYNNHVRWKNRNGTGYAVWKPNVSGSYNVYISWTIDSNRPTNANYTVYNDTNNSYNFTINQTAFPNGTTSTASDWSGWKYVGTFNFNSGNVTLWDDVNDSKVLIADAVKFESTKKNSVLGGWVNSTLWSGSHTITNSTGDGNNTLNISGAQDSVGRTVEENTSTWFMIGAAPKTLSVIISPSVGNTYVKAGLINFTIKFSQPMNTSVNPTVTFGQTSPYNMYTINGSWTPNSTTIWIGYYNITPSMSNVWYTISISGAKDLFGVIISQNTAYRFLVDTRPPRIWDIRTSNITIEENETVSVKVQDDRPAGQESSGLYSVIAELNGTKNYTMSFGYEITYIGSKDYVYYLIINNTDYGSGNQNLKFYVNDTAGNVNSNSTASFYVNSTIPQIGGKIAFLCRYSPVNDTCYDGIESSLISWLRSQGWTVDVKIYYKWNKTNLAGYDLMMCSDERYACDYATKSTTDVYYMYNNKKIPFVEISDDSLLRAAKNFGYVKYTGGSIENNINSLYVTISHPITSGYFGDMQIFSANRTMISISDTMLSGVSDIADAGNENGQSTLFSKDQSSRFVYIGWFYNGFSGLNSIGNTMLSRAISWAQCGNAKGCVFINTTCNNCVNPITGLCSVNCSGSGSYCNDANTTLCTCNVTECGGKSPSYSWCYLDQYRYDCQGCGGHHFIEDCGANPCTDEHNGTSYCGTTPPTTTTTTVPTTTTTTIPLTCNDACIIFNGYSSGTCRTSCSFLEKQLIGNYCSTFLFWQLKCCCKS